MAEKTVLREDDDMFLAEKLAIFQFDEEMAQEERRKPKVSADSISPLYVGFFAIANNRPRFSLLNAVPIPLYSTIR
jgi:hypothetical protein